MKREVGEEVSVSLIVVGIGNLPIEAGVGPGAEAVVQVLAIAENAVEENMMMAIDVDEVGLMKGTLRNINSLCDTAFCCLILFLIMVFCVMLVHLLFDGVSLLGDLLPQTNHLYLGMEVLMCVMPKLNDLPPLRVSLLAAAAVILVARLHMMRLM